MSRELLKRVLLQVVPSRYQLPLRFHYERLAGHLEAEMFLLPSWMSGKQRVVDVGANFGLYTYFLARLGKTVEAFEPLPGCAQLLKAYGCERIRVHEEALSSAPGTLRLFTPVVRGVPYPANSSFTPLPEPREFHDVAVRTLDQYSFEDVALLKIDVEGHELQVLRGAEQTLKRERPLLLVEVEQRHLQIPMHEVFSYVLDQGYKGFFLRAQELHPLSDFTYELHQEPFLGDVNHPGYINNFLFSHSLSPSPWLASRQRG
jgi:FkbM family methyltransferase